MAMNVFEGEVSWKRRLAIVLSILWLAVFVAVGAEERHGGLVIFLVFGLFPVVSLWGIWWVWSAYRRQKTPSQAMGNMFEGARRIAKLIAVFIVVGFGIAIATNSSRTVYLEYPYLISEPGGTPIRGVSCDSRVKRESQDLTIRRGVLVHTDLCFLYAPSESGVSIFGDLLYFQIPESDEEMITGLWWSQTLKNAGLYFLGMLASLAGLWAFTWTVGWIVRGFMGIPRGADSR